MTARLVVSDITVVGTAPPAGAPNPVEDFTIETTDGSPLIELSWSHDGVDLDRFEILRRPVGETTWERVILASASDFGTFPTYFYTAVSATDTQWVVRAMNSEGEVSV